MTDGFLSRWSRRKLDVQEGKPVLAEPPSHPLQPLPQPSPADGRGSEAAAAGGRVCKASAAGGSVCEASASGGRVCEASAFGGTESEASAFSARGRENSGMVAPLPLPPGEGGGEGAPEVPLPTLADAQALTPQSDFKPFMARGVAAEVKNAAMKKLFADPHYNVMDRLDTYIDDYSLPDPIPEAMLRQMVSAKFLNLFDEDEDKQDALTQAELNPAAAPVASPPSSVPSSLNAQHASLRDDGNTPTSEVVAQSQFTLQPPIDHDHTDMRLQPDHAPEGKNPGRGAA